MFSIATVTGRVRRAATTATARGTWASAMATWTTTAIRATVPVESVPFLLFNYFSIYIIYLLIFNPAKRVEKIKYSSIQSISMKIASNF